MSREEDNDQPSIAELRRRIQEEFDAAQRGLHGFAEVAKHERITKHMENMGELHEELSKIDEGADQFLVEVMEGKPEETIFLRYINSLDGIHWLGIDHPGEKLYYLKEGALQDLIGKKILTAMSPSTPGVYHGHVPQSYIQDYSKGKEVPDGKE